MLINLSKIVVAAGGVFLCGFGIWGFLAPQKLMQWVKDTMDAEWGFWFAILVRVLLGVTLLTVAPTSRFPSAFLVIGWIAIAAAIGVAMMGREILRKFAHWFLDKFSPALIRVWLLFALAFGGFLIYGVA